jgi:hypothetical protein
VTAHEWLAADIAIKLRQLKAHAEIPSLFKYAVRRKSWLRIAETFSRALVVLDRPESDCSRARALLPILARPVMPSVVLVYPETSLKDRKYTKSVRFIRN